MDQDLKHLAEAGLAGYALSESLKPKPPSERNVAYYGGVGVIVFFLFHWIIIPFWGITAIICLLPAALTFSYGHLGGILLGMIGLAVWVRYPFRWTFKFFFAWGDYSAGRSRAKPNSTAVSRTRQGYFHMHTLATDIYTTCNQNLALFGGAQVTNVRCRRVAKGPGPSPARCDLTFSDGSRTAMLVAIAPDGLSYTMGPTS